MTTREHTVESYLGDLIAVQRHVSEAIARHAKDEHLNHISGAYAVIGNAEAVLTRQLAALEGHAKSLGGTGVTGALKEGLTSVTGFITGLYGTIRGEIASRMLRDDYTGISFVLICTQMLHTTGLAVGDVTMTSMLRRHIEELAEVVIEINGVLPHAVVADLEADNVEIANASAGEEAARAHAAAWKMAGEKAHA